MSVFSFASPSLLARAPVCPYLQPAGRKALTRPCHPCDVDLLLLLAAEFFHVPPSVGAVLAAVADCEVHAKHGLELPVHSTSEGLAMVPVI